MIFGISMFHAIIQERKKFGPLGWNIIYEFNDSDRECAFDTLKMFCSSGVIPWDALEYITGEITYGGRVTDYWDLRCLKTILKGFFAPNTLDPNYKYSASGIYYCPNYEKTEQYRKFIDKFPIIEEPEIFGMHENANIAYQTKETQAVILTILESQPRAGGAETGKSSDEIVYEFSEIVAEKIKTVIISDEPYPALYKRDNKGRVPSLTTVLLQEIDRFNKLLKLIHYSLENLQKAIRGFVVMSDILEQVFVAFLNNQVPGMWAAKAYPSLKSLGGWVNDLTMRIDFIQFWLERGPPESFWLSGFFFPQGFLTGTLQTHARKYDLPIDTLKFDFEILNKIVEQETIKKYHDEFQSESSEIYGQLPHPMDGVNVHGLFMDAARFDIKKMILQDQLPGEMSPPFPAMTLTPVESLPEDDPRYISPMYKTSARAGVLSTTGHSTNFVVTVLIPTDLPQSYWILKGSALVTQIND